MEIVLAQGSSLLSRIIVWLTRDWSHVGIRYAPPDEEWMVHSYLLGVVPEWTDYFLNHYKKWERWEVILDPKASELALDRVVNKYKHKPFDYLGLVGFGIVLLLGKLGIKLTKNPLGSEQMFFCSEAFVAFVKEYRKADPNAPLSDLPYDLTSPWDVEEYMRAHPQAFRVKERHG